METVIDYAEKRLKDCEDYDKAYWAAYLDGARAQKREEEKVFYDKCGVGENGVVPDTDLYVRGTEMTEREKLIELIRGTPDVKVWPDAGGKIADHLIANGVTVQKWIPVTERLPEDDEGIVKNMVDEDFGFLTVLVYNGVVKQTNRYFSKENIYGLPKTNGWEWASFNVTHWMPLPEPPKEDEA